VIASHCLVEDETEDEIEDEIEDGVADEIEDGVADGVEDMMWAARAGGS